MPTWLIIVTFVIIAFIVYQFNKDQSPSEFEQWCEEFESKWIEKFQEASEQVGLGGLSNDLKRNIYEGTFQLMESNLNAFFAARIDDRDPQTCIEWMVFSRYNEESNVSDQRMRNDLLSFVDSIEVPADREGVSDLLSEIIWKIHRMEMGNDAPPPPDGFEEDFKEGCRLFYFEKQEAFAGLEPQGHRYEEYSKILDHLEAGERQAALSKLSSIHME